MCCTPTVRLSIALTCRPIVVLSTGYRPLGSCSRAAGWRCAGHAQQLGGESLLPNLMEVKGWQSARATAARRCLKEASSKRVSRWTKTEYKAQASDERASYREVHIHQGCKA